MTDAKKKSDIEEPSAIPSLLIVGGVSVFAFALYDTSTSVSGRPISMGGFVLYLISDCPMLSVVLASAVLALVGWVFGLIRRKCK